MYAPSRLELVLEGEQAPGLYEIEAQGDGRSELCVLDVPSAEGDVISCSASAWVQLGDEGKRIDSRVLEEFTPETVAVEALRDGERLASVTEEPDYAVDEPNGNGCGERSVATVELAL